MASEGPLSPGEQAFFWFKDASKVKDQGRWVKGKVLAHLGSTVTIETPTTVVTKNQSKVRRNHDEWHDFVLPPELEARQDQEAEPPHIGPDQEEPSTSVPVADPDISDSGVATQMQDQSLAYEIASSSDADYSGTDLYGYSFFCVDPAPALWQAANTKDVDLLHLFLVLREFLRLLPSRVCK